MAIRFLLRFAAVVLLATGAAMLVAPSAIAALFGLDPMGAAGDFMTRRYGSSGLVGLGTASWLATARPAAPAILGGLAAWFFVQAFVAISGLLAGTVGPIAAVPIVSDVALGAGAAVLAARLGQTIAKT
jgi:hypothetical protein